MTSRNRRSAPFLPVAFASLLCVACVSAQGTDAPPPQAVTPAEVAKAPDQFADKNVTLTGTLTAEGNYFPSPRNQKILLVDKTGSRVEVNRWLPSTPPRQSDTAPMRETLADYLGQEVELTGVLKKQDTPGSSTGKPIGGFLLMVKSAKVINR